MPFGYDALGWQVMGKGIELMLAVARWVNELPGAEGRVSAFGAGAVLIATAGFLVLTIPASKLRYGGIPLILLGLLWAAQTPRPDILVDAENGTVAVRGVNGRLSILDARRNRFTAEMWLAADGDGRKAGDDLGSGFRCDSHGCTARLRDGTIVAVARQREAFADDCREAGLIVTRHDVPESCRAAVIDRRMLETTGAIALRRVGGKWIAEPARSPFANRPWFGRARAADPQALLGPEGWPVVTPGADASIDDDGDEAGPGQDDAVDD